MHTYFFKCLLIGLTVATLWAGTGCKKEQDVFEVQKFHLRNENVRKGTPKSSLELMSIAHFDLFGSEISGQEVTALMQAYSSFGDKQVVWQRVLQNFLQRQNLDAPSSETMRADVTKFISETYRKFYAREPMQSEVNFFKQLIESSPELIPVDIYYAFLTSEEYLYY